MKKSIPVFLSDQDAEKFVANSDLSEYDLSGGRFIYFQRIGKEQTDNTRQPLVLTESVGSKVKE